jgi:sugar lactone lactonase YvrE
MRRAISALLAAAAVVLAVPAGAGAAFISPDSSFGSGTQPGGRFVQIGGVSTDNAGRVYVADTGSGRIEVFESGPFGNTYLRSIGEGVISQPVGVEVDLRNRIYVADQGGDRVVQFDTYNKGAPYMREWGGSGTELGKMSSPRFIHADRSGQVYNTEAGNARVQWFTPQDKQMVPVSAFGTAEPAPFDAPEGITRDDALGQAYVSNFSATDGAIRVFDSRGLFLGQLAGPGSGPGEVKSPRGMAIDPLGRPIVADSGNNRLTVFKAFSAGGGVIDSYGGDLSAPVDVAFAPGAIVYVTDAGSGRVMRLHYDDEDTDGTIDERDNCRGLSNPDQSNIDRDDQGDPCDPDADNDGVANDADKCPASRKGPDANGDGCSDTVAARRSVKCSTTRGTKRARAQCAARKRAAVRKALARARSV